MTRFCQYPLCHHPDQPLTGKAIKYHLDCQRIIDREKTIARCKRLYAQKKANPKPKVKVAKEDLCECCEINPIDRKSGFRKLCRLCWVWDGTGWMNEDRYDRPGNAEARRNTELVV